MPKSAQKRPNEPNEGGRNSSILASDHSYNSGADCSLQFDSEEDFPALPVTPSKPPLAKKPFSHNRSDSTFNSDDAVRSLAELINSRSDTIEKMVESVRVEIKDMNEKIVNIEKRVGKSEETALKCMNRVSDLESYGRRWNLRLQGLPEVEKEDVRAEVISVCQQVLPSEKERLPDAIDIAHRVGKPRHNDSKPRGIILRFISRRQRDAIWKAAKNNAFLQREGLRFAEDMSKEDRENRQKLWPMIKSAREQGKPAYFVGGRGFINGAEIHSQT